MMFKCNHFASRWLDVLDSMIEKVKGIMINKLRTTKIIDVDLKLLMVTFLGTRTQEDYENDKRKSKHNYGSRNFYSEESALLEKRLMLDLAKRRGE